MRRLSIITWFSIASTRTPIIQLILLLSLFLLLFKLGFLQDFFRAFYGPFKAFVFLGQSFHLLEREPNLWPFKFDLSLSSPFGRLQVIHDSFFVQGVDVGLFAAHLQRTLLHENWIWSVRPNALIVHFETRIQLLNVLTLGSIELLDTLRKMSLLIQSNLSLLTQFYHLISLFSLLTNLIFHFSQLLIQLIVQASATAI